MGENSARVNELRPSIAGGAGSIRRPIGGASFHVRRRIRVQTDSDVNGPATIM